MRALSSPASAVPETAAEYARWVEPHLSAMTRLAARLGPIEDRDDIVQEALVRAWHVRRRYDSRRGSPATFLLAITADQARQALRRRRRRPWTVGPHASSASSDDAVDVERGVAELPARQRLAVDCFYFVGLSVAETAAVMGCSEGTVKSTLSDARRRLKPLLEVTG